MAAKNVRVRTFAPGGHATLNIYEKAGIDILEATGDTIKDAMDITSDIIIDAGYFMHTIMYGIDEGKPIEYAGKAAQRFAVDVAGAAGAIRGSVVIGKARMEKAAADSAEEARKIREGIKKREAAASASK